MSWVRLWVETLDGAINLWIQSKLRAQAAENGAALLTQMRPGSNSGALNRSRALGRRGFSALGELATAPGVC